MRIVILATGEVMDADYALASRLIEHGEAIVCRDELHKINRKSRRKAAVKREPQGQD